MDAKRQEETPFLAYRRSSAFIKQDSRRERAFEDALKFRRSKIQKDGSFALHRAVSLGDTETVREIIEEKELKKLNRVDTFGMTPLHYAAKFDHKDIAALLLDHDASVNVKTEQGSPLTTAIRYRKEATAALLLSRGANTTLTDADGMNALHLAVNNRLTEIVTQLLQTFLVDLNLQDNMMNTALHYAAINDDVNICKALLDHGASIDVTNTSEETALHLAAGENNKDIVEVLLNLDLSKLPFTKKEFVEKKKKNKKTALILASQTGSFEILHLLIEHGADVNTITSNGGTALHSAASSGNETAVKLLLEHGINPDVKDSDGRTPLHHSVLAEKLSVSKILLSNGACLDVKDKQWATPFLLAVKKNNRKLTKWLLDCGASVGEQDVYLKTGLHYAVEHGDHGLAFLIVQRLKTLIRVKDEEGRSPLHYAAHLGCAKILQMFMSKTNHVNDCDKFGETALHLASKNGHADCVELLVEKGMEKIISVCNAEKQTPLHLAVINNKPSVCLALLSRKADVDAIGKMGWTPLFYAVSHEDLSVLRILLQHNADLNFADKWGNTCLMIAAESDKADAVSFLLESGADLQCTNKDGDNFFDLAIDFQRESVCRVIIESSRWREALASKGCHGSHFMHKLIKQYPGIAEIVLDRSTSFSHHHPEDPSFTVTFDFEFLEESPISHTQSVMDGIDIFKMNRNHRYFAPKLMSKYGRERLTRHPIVSTLISLKWNRISRYFYYMRFIIFLIFNVLLNIIVVLEGSGQNIINKNIAKQGTNETLQNPFLPSNKVFGDACGYVVLILAIVQIFIEIFKLIICRIKYFYRVENYIEVVLYFSTIVYMDTFLFSPSAAEEPFEVAILCIFLAWTNHLLYLQGMPMFRIYMAMFIKVCTTVMKLLITFSTILLAFTLIFCLLYIDHSGTNEIGVVMTRVMVMMTGELDFGNLLFQKRNKKSGGKDSELPYEVLSYIVFNLFLFLMTIAFTNLLIGLAVGDIEYVRSSAKLDIFKQELRLIRDIQGVLPAPVLSKFMNQTKYTYEINKQTKFERLLKFLTSDTTDADLKRLRVELSDFLTYQNPDCIESIYIYVDIEKDQISVSR